MKRKEMKKLYEEGNHICVSRWVESESRLSSDKGFGINERPDFSDPNGEFKLIHKRHERILDAALAGKEILVCPDGYTKYVKCENFIEEYNCNYSYVVKREETNYDFQEFSKAIDKQLGKECAIEAPDYKQIAYVITRPPKCFGSNYRGVRDFTFNWNNEDMDTTLNTKETVICGQDWLNGIFNLKRYGFEIEFEIKKPWYEIPDNFPCVIKWKDRDKDCFDVAVRYKRGEIFGNVDSYFTVEAIERATKEEVLSLFKETK